MPRPTTTAVAGLSAVCKRGSFSSEIRRLIRSQVRLQDWPRRKWYLFFWIHIIYWEYTGMGNCILLRSLVCVSMRQTCYPHMVPKTPEICYATIGHQCKKKNSPVTLFALGQQPQQPKKASPSSRSKLSGNGLQTPSKAISELRDSSIWCCEYWTHIGWCESSPGRATSLSPSGKAYPSDTTELLLDAVRAFRLSNYTFSMIFLSTTGKAYPSEL